MERKNKLRTAKIAGIVVFNLICVFSVIYVFTMSIDKKQAIGADAGLKVINDFEAPNKDAKNAGVNTSVTEPVQGKETAKPVGGAVQPAAAPSSEGRRTRDEGRAPAAPASVTEAPGPGMFLVDDFTGDEIQNKLGSRANVYVRAPSRVMVSRRDDNVNGVMKKVLMIKYDKKNSGGPNGMGGWCGYYTLVKNEKTGEYFDGTGYKYITLWIKGQKGDENLMIGCADEHWDKIGDSLKAEEIGVHLKDKKITTKWEKAKIPLSTFFLDHANLSAISINFEPDCFPEGAGAGTIFISDIAFEK